MIMEEKGFPAHNKSRIARACLKNNKAAEADAPQDDLFIHGGKN